jgi:hypothetical protein
MTKQSTMLRSNALEQALQTVIHDVQIPKNLRTALESYRRQSAEHSNSQVEAMCPEHKEISRSSEADPYSCDSPSLADEDSVLLSCESIIIAHGLRIIAKYDKQSVKWSIDINGQRYERVTFKAMEALIEGAVIATEISLKREFCRRPQ